MWKQAHIFVNLSHPLPIIELGGEAIDVDLKSNNLDLGISVNCLDR